MAKPNTPVYQEEQELKQIRKDLITVVILNVIFFAILLGLYYWNQSTGKVDELFKQLLHF